MSRRWRPASGGSTSSNFLSLPQPSRRTPCQSFAGLTKSGLDDGLLAKPAIQQWPLDRLHPNPKNARTHSARQITKIAASIRAFGFLSPIVADETGLILAGHGRYAAAKELELAEVPVIPAAHLTEA